MYQVTIIKMTLHMSTQLPCDFCVNAHSETAVSKQWKSKILVNIQFFADCVCLYISVLVFSCVDCNELVISYYCAGSLAITGSAVLKQVILTSTTYAASPKYTVLIYNNMILICICTDTSKIRWINLLCTMLRKAGGPTSWWSQSTDREIGNVSWVGWTSVADAGFSHMLLSREYCNYSQRILNVTTCIMHNVHMMVLHHPLTYFPPLHHRHMLYHYWFHFCEN